MATKLPMPNAYSNPARRGTKHEIRNSNLFRSRASRDRYSDFGFFDASNLFGSGYAGLGTKRIREKRGLGQAKEKKIALTRE